MPTPRRPAPAAPPDAPPEGPPDAPAVAASSGNVFADLELPDADDLLAKGELAVAIRRLVAAAGWTQQEAAERLDTTQPNVSNLLRGRLDGFTFDRLLRYLTALGQDVRLVVAPKPATRPRARLRTTVHATRPPRRRPALPAE